MTQPCNCGKIIYCKNKCKSCYMKEYAKNYYVKNKEKEVARLKKYKNENKEAEKQRNIKWNLENRDHINKRERNRYENDIQAKLSNVLRTRLIHAVRNNQKSGSAVQDLGCSISELKIYLESKFQPGMTWDNHGDWHIDHIKPLAGYKLENRNELLEACHYSNLQPLWKTDNLSKGKKEE